MFCFSCQKYHFNMYIGFFMYLDSIVFARSSITEIAKSIDSQKPVGFRITFRLTKRYRRSVFLDFRDKYDFIAPFLLIYLLQ
ncbi:hypothetical protein BN903_215 [Halorubrum sp. AJ67]|nr:hypothetical protein BN903_215 [Halorubrum sp. AJ67]